MSDELKPCAHCAEPGIEVEQRRGDFYEWSIECSRCCCRTDWYGSREAAVAAWNRRAEDALSVDNEHWQHIAVCNELLEADKYALQDQVDSLTAELEETQKKLKDCSREVFCRIAENNNLRSTNSFLNDTMTEQIAKLLDENDCIEVSERGIDGKRRLVTGTQHKLEKQVEELTAERDEWKSECSKLTDKIGEITNEASELMKKQPYTFDVHDVPGSLQTVGRYIDELTAERDELQSIIDHMPKTEQECEACQDAHDRLMFNAKVHQDELRDKLKHKQLVIDRQRDSFAKMEREYRELQDVCGELERTIENLRGD